MEIDALRRLLDDVKTGSLPIDDAMARLRDLPYEDLGFAKLDHHRALRNGFPEVIYCPGKTTEHIITIAERLSARSNKVLATRATPEVAEAIRERFPNAIYKQPARIVIIPGIQSPESGVNNAETGATSCCTIDSRLSTPDSKLGIVLVLSAGTADMPVAEEAAVTAEELGSPVDRAYDVGVAGIHRLLDQRERLFNANVIIVVAGMEGALASVVGGLVNRPVVAVPTSVGYGASFQGLAALLAMLNCCASGVAVMNIDNGFGAGYFAHMVNQR